MKIINALNFVISFIFLNVFSISVFAQASYVSGSEYADSLGGGSVGPPMIVLPKGSFITAGAGSGQDGSRLGRVVFERSFAISQSEITRGLYRHYLEDTQAPELSDLPISLDQDALPIVGITWDEAEAFSRWLSRKTGNNYRLPSSSEWEYAARAGNKTIYNWGDKLGENRANCKDCKVPSWNGEAMPVHSFAANDWNVFDMHGNVWEWTKDCLDSNSGPPGNGGPKLFGNCNIRELRGGSAQSDGWSIRISSRAYGQQDMRSSDVGLRVVMDVPEDE